MAYIRCSAETHRTVKVESAKIDLDMGEYVRRAVTAYLHSNHRPTRETHTNESYEAGPKSVTIRTDPEEVDAVNLLLSILRHGKDVHKQAVMWNLRGWAESAGNQGGEQRSGSSFSEAINDLIQSAEATGKDEESRQKWVADLRRIKAEFDASSAEAGGHGKTHRRRSS